MRFLLVFFIFSVTSCGSIKRGIKVHLISTDKIQTEAAINLINITAAKTIVELADRNEYVIIYKVPNESLAGHIAGVAYVGGVTCKISIPERTFAEGEDFLATVVWHEIGHCYKLNHTSDPYDIMYKSVYPLSMYTEEKKQEFLRRLYEAAH